MTIAALFSLSFSCTACSDDDEEDDNVGGGGSTELSVTIEPASKTLAFEAAGGSQDVVVVTEPTVTLTPADNWLTIAAQTPDGNKQRFTVTATANTGAARTSSIAVKAEGFAGTTIAISQAAPITQEPTETPDNIVQKLGMGWNLGNQLDAHNNGVAGETAWGNPACTQATFDALKAAGFRTVRIPVTWLGKVTSKTSGTTPTYTIDSDYLKRVAEVVGYAEKAGLNAIVNIHHDGANSKYWLKINATSDTENKAIKERLRQMWTQIATKFADKGDFLIFETMNEIHDGRWGWGSNTSDGGTQYKRLNEWQQICVDAIRATGGKNATDRWIAVQGYCTNPTLTLNNLVIPTDAAQRIMVSVHFYDPNTYTLDAKYPQWGIKATGSKETWGNEDNVKKIFGQLKTKYVDNGIPVYIGEMAACHRADRTEECYRLYWLEYVCKAAREYQLTPIYWDNGARGTGAECEGIIHHGNGSWINNGQEVASVMVNAVENTDAAYTLDAVYAKSDNVLTSYGE